MCKFTQNLRFTCHPLKIPSRPHNPFTYTFKTDRLALSSEGEKSGLFSSPGFLHCNQLSFNEVFPGSEGEGRILFFSYREKKLKVSGGRIVHFQCGRFYPLTLSSCISIFSKRQGVCLKRKCVLEYGRRLLFARRGVSP